MKKSSVKISLIFILCFLSKAIHSVETEKIYIHYINRPPYFIKNDKTKKLDNGVLYKIIESIFNNAKLAHEFIEVPSPRTHIDIKRNNENICHGYSVEIQQRKSYGVFSLPYFQDKPYVLVHRKNDMRFNKYQSLTDILSDFNLILLLKFKYTFGKYVDSQIEKIKKHNIDITEDENNGKTGLQLTYVENINMLQQISSNRADYMMITENEFQYLKNTNKDIKNNLTFKRISDITIGNKRVLFCSKKIGDKNMEKLNNSILKVSGKI
jgi:hypothetical protein